MNSQPSEPAVLTTEPPGYIFFVLGLFMKSYNLGMEMFTVILPELQLILQVKQKPKKGDGGAAGNTVPSHLNGHPFKVGWCWQYTHLELL